MPSAHRRRRLIAAGIALGLFLMSLTLHDDMWQTQIAPPGVSQDSSDILAVNELRRLEIKGRAPKTGYSRDQFGAGWGSELGCDVRNIILKRDLTQIALDDQCRVISGQLHDPYTGETIDFRRGASSSQAVQIDHVVALSNAWQTGAQNLSYEKREQLANDPLELLAVSGEANQQKSAGDAATWLPANKAFRCQYVARQISVKSKYELWVTPPERAAMERVLSSCPGQTLPKS